MPTVSVITPTYNRADVLPRAIESVQRQTFDDYEHFIIDDGSTDDTHNVVGAYDDENIEYVPLDSNYGVAEAWNHGVERAEGEYISFLDSDDAYDPNRLAVLVEILSELPDRVGGVFHGYRRIHADDTSTHSVPDGEIDFQDMAQKNPICGTSNTMYRASVFDQVAGFDEDFPAAVDEDFQLRVLEGFTLYGVGETLCDKYVTPDGIQRDPERVRAGVTALVEKHGDRLADTRLAWLHRQIATSCLETGDVAAARTHFDREIEHRDPSRKKCIYEILGRLCLERDARRLARHYLLRAVRRNHLNHRAHAWLLATLIPVRGARSIAYLRALRDAVRKGT
jgi:glycosyltransferase involved in cell wall biosynthesis